MKYLLLLLLFLLPGCATKPASSPLSNKEIQKIMAPYVDDGLARALQGF